MQTMQMINIFREICSHHSGLLVLLNNLLDLAGFLALPLNVQKHALHIFRGYQQLRLKSYQDFLHPADFFARAVQPAETSLVSLLTLQYLLSFPVQ